MILQLQKHAVDNPYKISSTSIKRNSTLAKS